MSRFIASILLVATVSSFSTTANARRLVAPPIEDRIEQLSIAPRTPDHRMPMGPDSQMRVMPTRAEVRKALGEARAKNLASFHAYMRKGKYPNNVFTTGLANVWRDQQGNFCAAATIMVMSGHEDLAIEIGDDNNFLRLADVKQGSVMDWILTSGFTQAELALIQKPFSPVTKVPELAPEETIAIDPTLRAKETARLRALYKQVDKQLVAKQKKSLELATDRLMKNPTLAWQLIHG